MADSGSDPSTSADSGPANTPTPVAVDEAEVTADATSTMGSYEIAHATRTALRACAVRLAAGQDVVTEADTSVGHWSEHVQAQTDMAAGLNTLDETKAIWKRTRLAGPGDVDRFATVLATYNEFQGCDDLDAAQAPASLRADAEACASRAARIEATVAAAAAAVGDWENHLAAMAAHAGGEMDSGQAQQMWLEAWENAPTNINGFHDTRDQLAQAPECEGPNG